MADIEMTNLIAAEEELNAAERELARYRAALKLAGEEGSVKAANLRAEQQDLKELAVDFYLNPDDHNADDVLKHYQRIRDLEHGLAGAEIARTQLDFRIVRLSDNVQRKISAVNRLKELAERYEKGKRLYPETYARAKQDRDRPLLDSTADATWVIRLRSLRDDLRDWSRHLGCEDDCQEFLSSIEQEV